MKANKLENFTIEQINRQDIRGADYNPRKITESARKKLKQGIKRWGAVQPIVVNKRTMTIVGGHQRIQAMDDILRKDNYELSVAMIDVDEKDEVSLNVFLNNSNAQGEWDILALQSIKDAFTDIDFESDLGFDQSDIDILLYDDKREEQEEFDIMTDVVSKAKKDNKTEEYREAKKKARQDIKEAKEAGEADVTSIDYVIQIVFPNNHEKHEFMRKIRKDPKEKYLKSSILLDIYNHVYDISVFGGKP